MANKIIDKQDFQEEVNLKYGEGEWTVLEFTDKRSSVALEHKCGAIKRYSRGTTFTNGRTVHCSKCDSVKKGRPTLTFEELDARIKGATYSTYELVSLIDSSEFIVRHTSCNRKPFKTSVTRFFSKNQRCQCSKRGVVGRKPNGYVDYEN